MATELHVWMNGQRVGTWGLSRSKTSVFQYHPAWLQSPQARALSLSLPITTGNLELRGAAVENYFDNLLPDSAAIRLRVRGRFNAKSTGAFDLLQAIGRDCVGAVQLLAPQETPHGWNQVQSEAMTHADVARALHHASTSTALGQHADPALEFRISIAGAQEKTALLFYGGQWHRPLGATPTTHILKLPLGLVGNMRADMKDSVENEWLCASILAAMGLDVAPTRVGVFEDQKALIVQRFDRRWQGLPAGQNPDAPAFSPRPNQWIARVPQEDFCQVTATPPAQKYENDGGPGIAQILQVLRNSQNRQKDCTQFALAQLAFWLLAATDGHAKNFSIFLNAGNTYQMTPLYDVLSAWPIIGKGADKIPLHNAKLAMALRGKNTHYKLMEIQPRHWQQLANACGVEGLWDRMVELVEAVPHTLQTVQSQLPSDFPQELFACICENTRKHGELFLRGLQAKR